MQTTVKDTYIVAQSRMMYLAYIFFSILSIVLLIVESVHLANPDNLKQQMLSVMSLIIGFMFNLLAMLIVEITFQDEIENLPIVSYLSRLTPDLTVIQRYGFLVVVLKRQIISMVFLVSVWIALGGSMRGWSLVFGMGLIVALTIYGIHHLQSLPPETLELPVQNEAD